MTALGTDAIRIRLKNLDPNKRLVISPLLDEDEQAKLGQAAVDVRLGFDFGLVTASSIASISEFQTDGAPASFGRFYRREYVPFGACITIHPHQFMLAQTLEYIRLPYDLMAYVVGRSTWGRVGLTVATAIGVHPGFSGSLTLELRNLGETPLTLYPGQTVAQLFFHLVVDATGVAATAVAQQAQYVGVVDMIPQRFSSAKTRATLERLIERFNRDMRT